MNIENETIKFLSENFSFKMFEIDNWFNDENIYRYQHKRNAKDFKEELGIEFLIKKQIEDWRYVDNKSLDYFFEEFVWFMFSIHNIKTGLKSQKKVIKDFMLELIKNQLSEAVFFDKRIEPFTKQKRIKTYRIKTLPTQKRVSVDLKVGDKCFIYRNSSGSAIVDPCFVYAVNEDDELKYSIMYFTNFGDYGRTTEKLEINGYNFAKVYPTEIGQTPEEAVKNKY